MKNPIRTQGQVQKTQDKQSAKGAKRYDPKKDKTRQEFQSETDTHQILKRAGITGGAPQTAPVYRDFDFDMDLQQGLAAERQVKEGFGRLPKELRDKYGNWEEVFAAVQAGEITMDTLTGEMTTDAVAQSTQQNVPSSGTGGRGNSDTGTAQP